MTVPAALSSSPHTHTTFYRRLYTQYPSHLPVQQQNNPHDQPPQAPKPSSRGYPLPPAKSTFNNASIIPPSSPSLPIYQVRGSLPELRDDQRNDAHALACADMSSLAAAAAAGTTTLRKICTTCGRQITWRKKWEKNWEAISYCSDSCRKHKIKPNSLDTAFESRILSLLTQRKRALGVAAAVVTCEEAEAEVLSELKASSQEEEEEKSQSSGAASREGEVEGKTEENDPASLPGESLAGNRQHSEPTRTRERCRQAARRLAARGTILVTQEGKVVDPSFAKGVMELKLPS